MSNIEQTLSIIKPDAVERNLAEKIKEKFLENELIIKNQKKNTNYKRRSCRVLQGSSNKAFL